MSPASRGLHSPLIVSVCDFDQDGLPREDESIRRLLDETIEEMNRVSSKQVFRVDATAQTIFPHMCWSPRKPVSADALFARYVDRVFPRLKCRNKLNRRGTYFLRMIRATGFNGRDPDPVEVNQLGKIIRWSQERNKRPINSITQVSIRDPAKDHHGAALSGFPCLQQVALGRYKSTLTVSAFFPTENIFERGYGNYLGLARLGCFMAYEMKLTLVRLNVYIAQPRPPEAPKGGALAKLQRDLDKRMRALGDEPCEIG